MLRYPTARVFDSEAPVYGPRGEIEDVGRNVIVRAAGPIYDSVAAGRDTLPDLATLSDDDRDYLADRAYDACKVSDDDVREEASSWRR